MQIEDTLRYELPPGGTTLLSYIVRRMHKTLWLLPVGELLAGDRTAEALAHIAMYAVAASTSFGRAFYQPTFDRPGDEVSEPDPSTGAVVTARLESSVPHYRISYEVKMPDGGLFQGREEITGTTIGLRGLGMPAPSQFSFIRETYSGRLTGLLTSELALSLLGRTRIRAYGFLNITDSAGNAGRVTVDRRGVVGLTLNGKDVEGKGSLAEAGHAA